MCNQPKPIQRLTLSIPSRLYKSRGWVTTMVGLGLIASLETPVLANFQTIPTYPSLISQNLAQGSVIYVDSNTGIDSGASTGSEAGPYRSISYALQKAQPGTVIQVNPGTYSQETGESFPIVLPEEITLQGDVSTNGQNTVIMGGGNFVSPTFARQNATIRTEGNSQILGLTLTNPNTRGTALWIESSNPTVSNCTFINSKRDGVFISAEGNPKISSNIFTQNAGNGISIARSAGGEIRNNIFQNTGFGISINDEATPTITENKIIENRDGIVISHQAKPILRNNLIENNERDGVVAISQAQPDLGTATSPGQNIIRSNGRYDVYNATRGFTLTVVGNEIDQSKISGAVEF
ncbi:DUF1565 domain-containing protein [Planktothrix mougeotii]|uniref:DUF1565 domain-containing protein n=1 Tax=Planktothrix mougeotii LEGE 06226 TaxID=1828728 RepID=A0ABR9UG90_9CYAN|nr:DUF1565 domain-containing protein [Planktothrix mougeotii]MBE9145468.1 DUF1565 domain-containing protein [Planktothrix mougeotii LEGE 06226]